MTTWSSISGRAPHSLRNVSIDPMPENLRLNRKWIDCRAVCVVVCGRENVSVPQIPTAATRPTHHVTKPAASAPHGLRAGSINQHAGLHRRNFRKYFQALLSQRSIGYPVIAYCLSSTSISLVSSFRHRATSQIASLSRARRPRPELREGHRARLIAASLSLGAMGIGRRRK